MNDLIGHTLRDKYRIIDLLGAGAMGAVYRGTDTTTDREVAIKVLSPAFLRDEAMLRRFRREARAMRRVVHPNAVEVHAYGVEQGLVFLVMELVSGRDLEEVLAAERRLSAERAAGIMIEVCGALAAAHAQGIVHRDIKPANIMITSSEDVKLIDFGIAKPTDPLSVADSLDDIDESSSDDSAPDSVRFGGGLDLTTAGMLVGSPSYMAPEQWTGAPVDARTDIYACGVLLYQMVTGHLPYDGQDAIQVAILQRKGTPKSPIAHVPSLHPGLAFLILKSMATAPDDRFKSAAALRSALLALLPELSAQALPPSIPVSEAVPSTEPLPGHVSAGRAADVGARVSALPATIRLPEIVSVPRTDDVEPTIDLSCTVPWVPEGDSGLAATLPVAVPHLPDLSTLSGLAAADIQGGKRASERPPSDDDPTTAFVRLPLSKVPVVRLAEEPAPASTPRAQSRVPIFAALVTMGIVLGVLAGLWPMLVH